MSVDMATVPLWKQSLLERKRRQEENSRIVEKEEEKKLSTLPNWKKDLLIKKHGQQNSFVFVARETNKVQNEKPNTFLFNGTKNNEEGLMSHSGVDQAVTDNETIIQSNDVKLPVQNSNKKVNISVSEYNGDIEEHLLPVNQNPWLRSDPIRHTRENKRLSDTNVKQTCETVNRSEISHKSWSGEIDILQETKQEIEDNVFDEEVAYGKGFVHKLLRRFSRLTSPEPPEDRGRKHSRTSASRRSHSAENILDDNKGYSPREYRSSTAYLEQLSPRSPNRSQSTDSISSPRSVGDTNTLEDNKMGVADKSKISSTIYESNGTSNDSSSLLSPSWENISEAEDELPKKNIVASARNVFENIAAPIKPSKKPAPLGPKPARSPKNSVHSLIAIDNVGNDVIDSGNRKEIKCAYEKSSRTVDSQSQLAEHDTHDAKIDSISQSQNPAIKSQTETHIKSGKIKEPVKQQEVFSIDKSMPKGESEDKSSSGQSYYDLYFSKGSRQSNNGSEVTGKEDKSGYAVVNGDISVSEQKDSSPQSPVSTPSVKKRKAPLPPPSFSKDSSRSESTFTTNNKYQNDTKSNNAFRKESGPNLIESHSKQIPKQAISQPKSTPTLSKIPLDTKVVASKPNVVDSKSMNSNNRQKNAAQVNSSASDARRPNLSLNLNKQPEVVKASTGSCNDAQSVIYNRGNKKAKIVTPKSSGPGSLLIRPASNMVQAKNAQFAKLEFKYDDIRTGEFAPKKKKPSYYDSDDDNDSDEDIPVTNIDDVISGNVSDDVKLAASRDRNANIAKKTVKYEFIGAGVISGKSSLSKRRKEVKVNIAFMEQIHTLYEYPSEQSLMADAPAGPGDYDYVDTSLPNGRLSSDDYDDDEDIMIEVEKVSQGSLKNNAAVSSLGQLSGYQSKMQFEYHFGMNMNDEPAPVEKIEKKAESPVDEPDFFKPADESETANWSETQSSDLLF